jgi:hypothetical protein
MHNMTDNIGFFKQPSRVRWAAIGAAIAVSLGGGTLAVVSASPSSSQSAFVPVDPVRVLDTRSGAKVGELDGSGAARELQLTGSISTPTGTRTVVPTGSTGVSLNVTAVSTEVNDYGGYVTVYPCGGTRPEVSNLNFGANAVVPNAVTVKVSSAGTVCLYVYGKAHLLVDVAGYYEASTGSGGVTGGARITELNVCDGPDAGTVADELCKIGMTGPGGGPVFFIDYQDQYASFCATGDCNYLEASPADVGSTEAWCSDTTTSLGLDGWSNSAIGAGRTNTATADTTCTTDAVQTAANYSNNGKDDWWLPSIGELMAMYTNLRQVGVGSFSVAYYWSSSEFSANLAWLQNFNYGEQSGGAKASSYRVRPVRGF